MPTRKAPEPSNDSVVGLSAELAPAGTARRAGREERFRFRIGLPPSAACLDSACFGVAPIAQRSRRHFATTQPFGDRPLHAPEGRSSSLRQTLVAAGGDDEREQSPVQAVLQTHSSFSHRATMFRWSVIGVLRWARICISFENRFQYHVRGQAVSRVGGHDRHPR